MTRDEHIAAAEKWLAEAEQMYNSDVDDGADVAAAGIIGLLHAALAKVTPIVIRYNDQPHPSSPTGQRHDGQETR